MSLSGGSVTSGQEWLDLLVEGKKDGYTIFIAAVGNHGKDLSLHPKERIYPAAFKISDTKHQNLVRVGAVKQYNDAAPEFWERGNFHKDFVDIAAPGHKIPVLVPEKDEAAIVQGTSESTAIVAGALAILAGCKPDVTAIELLKNGLYNGADSYPQLESYIHGGKVLNIQKAVVDFCLSNDIENLELDTCPWSGSLLDNGN